MQMKLTLLQPVKPGCTITHAHLLAERASVVKRRLQLPINAYRTAPKLQRVPGNPRLRCAASQAGQPANNTDAVDAVDAVLSAVQLLCVAAAAVIQATNTFSQSCLTTQTAAQNTRSASVRVATPQAVPVQAPSGGPVITLLLMAAAAGAWLNNRLRNRNMVFSGVRTGAQAAAKLVQMDAVLQQQGNDMAKVLQQTNKLQTRFRLSNRDYKLPIKQLQQRTAEHADVLLKLTQSQEKLDDDLRDTQELLNALQGLGAKQVKVMTDTFQRLQTEQIRLKQQIASIQDSQSTGKPPDDSPPSGPNSPQQQPNSQANAAPTTQAAAAPQQVQQDVQQRQRDVDQKFEQNGVQNGTQIGDELPHQQMGFASGSVAADRFAFQGDPQGAPVEPIVGPLIAMFNSYSASRWMDRQTDRQTDGTNGSNSSVMQAATKAASQVANGAAKIAGVESNGSKVNGSGNGSLMPAVAAMQPRKSQKSQQLAAFAGGKTGDVSAVSRCQTVLGRLSGDLEDCDDELDVGLPQDMLDKQYEVLLGRIQEAETRMVSPAMPLVAASAAASIAANMAALKPAASNSNAASSAPFSASTTTQQPKQGQRAGARQGSTSVKNGTAGAAAGRGVVLMGKPNSAVPGAPLEWVVVNGKDVAVNGGKPAEGKGVAGIEEKGKLARNGNVSGIDGKMGGFGGNVRYNEDDSITFCF